MTARTTLPAWPDAIAICGRGLAREGRKTGCPPSRCLKTSIGPSRFHAINAGLLLWISMIMRDCFDVPTADREKV
jgi:hypothetical protein